MRYLVRHGEGREEEWFDCFYRARRFMESLPNGTYVLFQDSKNGHIFYEGEA